MGRDSVTNDGAPQNVMGAIERVDSLTMSTRDSPVSCLLA